MKGELMMMKKTIVSTVFVFISVLFLLACAGDNKPAEMAVKAAEEAVNTAKTEAVKYVPDQVKSLEDSLVAVKDTLAKKDYKAVLTEAQALSDKAKEVMEAAKLKKEEMTASWTGISQELPKMVETMQSKVDLLSQAKKLPSEISTEKFAEAKAGLATLKEEWAKTLEKFNAGNIAEALSSATVLKEKALQTMGILGLSAPAATAVTAPETAAPEMSAPAPAAPEVAEPDKLSGKDRVKWLQQALNNLGADPKLAVDGILGASTKDAVKKFQTAAGMTADGKVGPTTEAAIKDKLAKK